MYLFYGDNDALLYVGKSVNLRQRVRSHFASDLREYKEMRLSQASTRRIHWHETVGELGAALLLESRLVKECQPIHNRRCAALRNCAPGPIGATGTRRLPTRDWSAAKRPISSARKTFGLFASRRGSHRHLHNLAAKHELCPIILGLEKPARPGRPCFAHQVKQCRGRLRGQGEAVGVHSVLACCRN
ncbi:MAG: GIY-YIG nuclease family protein [Candidatus Accumulibacter sp.]|nr:GIY-YIG nuclease family protein [Accumulibacter sp.]